MTDHSSDLPVLKDARVAGSRANFLPYPSSSSGPAIVPNDLTNFKTRGASETEKRLEQELKELHERYVDVVDRFNWNRLVYDADFRFEPIMGTTYHLYSGTNRSNNALSMVGPEEWDKPYIGSFRLNVDRCWEVVELAPDVNRDALFGN